MKRTQNVLCLNVKGEGEGEGRKKCISVVFKVRRDINLICGVMMWIETAEKKVKFKYVFCIFECISMSAMSYIVFVNYICSCLP